MTRTQQLLHGAALIVSVAVGFVSLVSGQTSSIEGNREIAGFVKIAGASHTLREVATLPATCTAAANGFPGEAVIRTSDSTLHYCSAADTWSQIGGSGGGGAGVLNDLGDVTVSSPADDDLGYWSSGNFGHASFSAIFGTSQGVAAWGASGQPANATPGFGIGFVGTQIQVDDAVIPQYTATAGAPSGACVDGRDYHVDTSTNTFHACSGGVWFTAAVADHGGLSGLTDDDHPIYVPVNGSRSTQMVEFTAQAAPADPLAGFVRLFLNTATGELSVRKSGGTTVSLEQGGGSGLAEDSVTPFHINDTVAIASGLGEWLRCFTNNTCDWRENGQVLNDIGAAAASHSHVEADISDLLHTVARTAGPGLVLNGNALDLDVGGQTEELTPAPGDHLMVRRVADGAYRRVPWSALPGAAGGAPADAPFLVESAVAGLSAEVVVQRYGGGSSLATVNGTPVTECAEFNGSGQLVGTGSACGTSAGGDTLGTPASGITISGAGTGGDPKIVGIDTAIIPRFSHTPSDPGACQSGGQFWTDSGTGKLHHCAGSAYRLSSEPFRTASVPVVDAGTDLAGGESALLDIPAHMDGWHLESVWARFDAPGSGGSGTTAVTVERCAVPAATGAPCSGATVAMLSTNVTIDADEGASNFAAIPAVVDELITLSAYQTVRVSVTAVQTGGTAPQGLVFELVFAPEGY